MPNAVKCAGVCTQVLGTEILVCFLPFVQSRTLQGNGIFSGISGVICIAGAGPITSFLGLSSPIILVIIGIVTLLYAVSLFLTTARQPIDLRSGLLYAIIDSAWVVGSVILLLTNWIPFTSAGKWSVGLVAVIVALFAELQFYGVWRARG